MSIDTSQILQPAAEPAQPAIPVQASPIPQQPAVQVAAAASGPTPAIAARALSDAVTNGSIVGSLQADVAANPKALFTGVGALLLVVLGVFVYLVIEAVHNGSVTAQHYLGVVFSATGVWVVVAGVLGVGLLAARSPLQDPPSIPGVSYPKGK